MTVSRRRLLRNCVGAAAACMAGQAWGVGQPGSRDTSGDRVGQTHLIEKPAVMTREFFAQALDSGFKVSLPSGNFTPVYLRLIKIDDLPAITPPDIGAMAVPPKQTTYTVTSGFFLSFNGSFPDPLSQGKYTFEHPQLGKFELFIVPGDPASQSYTAVVAYVGQTFSMKGGVVPPSTVLQPPVLQPPLVQPPAMEPPVRSAPSANGPGDSSGRRSFGQATQDGADRAFNRD